MRACDGAADGAAILPVLTRTPTGIVTIGGFLGAGRTTLLNHRLSGPGGAGLGVVVGDFGAIDIDEQLVTGPHGQVVSLANGCV